MGTVLTAAAVEESSYVVTAAFTDEDGNPVAPNALTWSLTDENGTIINERDAVIVAVPAASVDIVLQGDDLAVAGDATVRRVLTVEGDYDSAAGSGLPLRAAAIFSLEPLVAVS